MQAQQAGIAVPRISISRNALLSALLIVASANGVLPRAIGNIAEHGLLVSFHSTFGVSVIVWGAWAGACYLALQQAQQAQQAPIRRADLVLAFAVMAFVAVPVSSLSWVTLSLLSAYVFWISPKESTQRRSAAIFFAICVPMFWGPMFLTLAAGPLLRIDAFLVSLILGTDRVGNSVKFFDGLHNLQIWVPCSSFHNISQAAVAWVAMSQTLGRTWGRREIMWCALAFTSAIAVNLFRLSLMGVNYEYYLFFHGPIGEQIAGGLTIFLIVVICMIGLRRELFARA